MEARFPERRWDLFISSLFINVFAGASYDYAIYSPYVKAKFSLSQNETDNVGALSDLSYAALCPILAYVQPKLGPKRSSRLGAAISLLSAILLLIHLLHPLVQTAR